MDDNESLEDYVKRELSRQFSLAEDVLWHEWIHGIPCGPTLAMVDNYQRVMKPVGKIDDVYMDLDGNLCVSATIFDEDLIKRIKGEQ